MCVNHDRLTFKDSKYRRNPNKPHHNKKFPKPNNMVTASMREIEMCSLSEEGISKYTHVITYIYVVRYIIM